MSDDSTAALVTAMQQALELAAETSPRRFRVGINVWKALQGLPQKGGASVAYEGVEIVLDTTLGTNEYKADNALDAFVRRAGNLLDKAFFRSLGKKVEIP